MVLARNAYLFNLYRNIPAMLTRPVPKKIIELGSGVVVVSLSPLPVMFVSPLESIVEPLKNPLPALTVSWTVAAFTVCPVNHVPLKLPVRV